MRDPAFDHALRGAVARFAPVGRVARWTTRIKLGADPVYRELLERGIADARRVVDLGCGRGLLFSLILAAQRNDTRPELCGIEIDPAAVRIARRVLNDAATIIEGDLAESPVPPCDIVALVDVAHYLPLAVQNDLPARVRKALPVGGRFFVREADASAGVGFLAIRAAERIAALVGGYGPHRLAYQAISERMRRLEAAGFSVAATPMGRGTPFANVLLEARAIA